MQKKFKDIFPFHDSTEAEVDGSAFFAMEAVDISELVSKLSERIKFRRAWSEITGKVGSNVLPF